jgi:hypothetical protein
MLGANVEMNIVTDSYIKRAVVVTPRDFTNTGLERLAREFVQEAGRVPFGVLYIATDSHTWGYYTSKGATDMTFEGWSSRMVRSLRDGWEPLANIAEVNIIEGEAVLRFRRSGAVGRIVLTGHDPLDLGKSASMQSEILEMQSAIRRELVNSEGPHFRCKDCLQSVELFVRMRPEINMAELERIGKRFAPLARQADLIIVARTDPWFVESVRFPMLYAFEVALPLPSFDQYRRGRWAMLEFSGGTHKLRSYGPHGGQVPNGMKGKTHQ